ncbi:MAG: NADH-quinone oxidoreductase subunit M, partial [Deltaproteobacteria bacterium]|nr:NADH-quinone oxidoreductase subunit M [Deltaproteobacteria bacterium]
MNWILNMPILDTHLLSVLTFLPLVAVLILLFVKNEDFIRAITLITMVLVFIISIALVLGFDSSTHMMQFVEKGEWITALNINYHMGVDGISVLFILLTALIGWVCVLASWRAIDKRVKEFMICLLVMQTAMTGVFCSLDFFLFYIFWEVMLIPM